MYARRIPGIEMYLQGMQRLIIDSMNLYNRYYKSVCLASIKFSSHVALAHCKPSHQRRNALTRFECAAWLKWCFLVNQRRKKIYSKMLHYFFKTCVLHILKENSNAKQENVELRAFLRWRELVDSHSWLTLIKVHFNTCTTSMERHKQKINTRNWSPCIPYKVIHFKLK